MSSLNSSDVSLKQHVVAYIDFLGITEIMKTEDSVKTLNIIQFLINNTKYTANYISQINEIGDYKIKVFSDNIIIALEVNYDIVANQIISMVNLVGSIQFWALMQFGLWLRGSVTVGHLFIDDTIVWGEGLVQAYSLENYLARYPRIIVSKEAVNTYDECKKKELNLYALIKNDMDGSWFVDFLLAAPNIKLIPDISKCLQERIKDNSNNTEKVEQSMNWMIKYFNNHCDQINNRGDYKQYKLEQV